LSVHIKPFHVEKDAIIGYDHIKEGTIKTAQLADKAVTNAKIADATIAYTKLADDTIRLIVDFPILGGAEQTVAADAVGTPTFAHTSFKLPTDALRHAYSTWVQLDYVWAPTADGYFELYDEDAAAVRGKSTTKTGGESSEWEGFEVTGLVEGNKLVLRANITTAGAAGETVSLYRVRLRIAYRIS